MTAWMIWTVCVSALLAGAAAMVERVVASFGAVRRFVWVVAALVATIGPAVVAVRPVHRQDTTPSQVIRVGTTLGATGAVGQAGVAAWQRMSHFAATVGKADGLVLRGWLFASATMLIVIAGGDWRTRRRARGWIEADTEFGRVFVSHSDGPAVVGSFQPAIVVPRWALGLDRMDRNLMLRHESEHVRAHDSRVLFAAALVVTVFPWNAALWWMLRRLRLAIEIDCDGRVIRSIGEARAYGAMLLSVGERYATRPTLAASMAEAGAHLEARITAMMMPAVPKPLRAALPFALLALGTVAVAAWLPAPAPAQVVRLGANASVVEPRPLRGNPSPRYPEDLVASGVEGEVTMTFETDARGVPDTTTIRVLRSSHESFEASIRKALPQWRYDSQGHVRFAARFMGLDTERREASGAARSPSFVVEGAPVMVVVVVAQLDRPARRTP
jgi:hypothetical protein